MAKSPVANPDALLRRAREEIRAQGRAAPETIEALVTITGTLTLAQLHELVTLISPAPGEGGAAGARPKKRKAARGGNEAAG